MSGCRFEISLAAAEGTAVNGSSAPTLKMVHWMEMEPTVSHLDLAVGTRRHQQQQQQRRRVYHGGGGGGGGGGGEEELRAPSHSPSSEDGEFRKKSGTWP